MRDTGVLALAVGASVRVPAYKGMRRLGCLLVRPGRVPGSCGGGVLCRERLHHAFGFGALLGMAGKAFPPDFGAAGLEEELAARSSAVGESWRFRRYRYRDTGPDCWAAVAMGDEVRVPTDACQLGVPGYLRGGVLP